MNNKLLELISLFEDCSPDAVIFSKLSAEFSVVLAGERLKRNMTQTEFAELLGVKQSQVSNWEKGGYNFSLKTIAKYSAVLDLNVNIHSFPRTIPSSSIATVSSADYKNSKIISLNDYKTNRYSKLEVK